MVRLFFDLLHALGVVLRLTDLLDGFLGDYSFTSPSLTGQQFDFQPLVRFMLG